MILTVEWPAYHQKSAVPLNLALLFKHAENLNYRIAASFKKKLERIFQFNTSSYVPCCTFAFRLIARRWSNVLLITAVCREIY